MVGRMTGDRRRIDRVLESAFVADATELPIEDLRQRRQEAMQEEADLSYVRRMLQGRIEILQQAVDLSNENSEQSDDQLVARLTTALVGTASGAPVVSARHSVAEPGRMAERRRFVERLIADVGLSDPDQMTSEDSVAALVRLRETEQAVSATRAQVHGVIDVLTNELGSRYRNGEA